MTSQLAEALVGYLKTVDSKTSKAASEDFLCTMRPRSFFQYVIGSFVQLSPGGPMQRVIWRGKQVVPSITGRQPYEVPVYRLSNEYWDCYYEHELHAALPRQ